MPTLRYVLRKYEILRSKALIEQLFKEGKSYKTSFLRILYTHFVEHKPLQSGILVMFVVSKKSVRHAVKRNRIKRLMREAYRLEKSLLMDLAAQQMREPTAIGIIYTGKAWNIPTLELFRHEMRALFALLNESSKASQV